MLYRQNTNTDDYFEKRVNLLL